MIFLGVLCFVLAMSLLLAVCRLLYLERIIDQLIMRIHQLQGSYNIAEHPYEVVRDYDKEPEFPRLKTEGTSNEFLD